MLPEIDEETLNKILPDILKDVSVWRKSMIHYIKEENPEVNTAIIEIANKTQLDPKALATGAYMTYCLLADSAKKQDDLINFEE